MARRRGKGQDRIEDNQRADNSGSLDFNLAPRAAQALRLRRLGYTYDEIALEIGYTHASAARKLVKREEAKIIRDEAVALVGWQLDRIDWALRVVLKRVLQDDANSLWAVDRLVPLLKRQAELMALDAEKDSRPENEVVVREIPVGYLGEVTRGH